MRLPDTPKTIIEQLVDTNHTQAWNCAWQRFFDIYHAPIKVMALNSFYKFGWYGAPSHAVDDVVADVVVSLNKIFSENAYDREKSRFRFLLKTVCDRRVVDYIRKNSNGLKTDSLDNENSGAARDAETVFAENEHSKLAEEEARALRQSLLIDVYMSIRHNFDPRTCAAFEMVKLEDANMDDIVKELGVSPNVVNNAVFRITKKLKETLAKNNLKSL